MQHAELPHALVTAARDAVTIMASCHDGLHPQTTIHRKKLPFIFFHVFVIAMSKATNSQSTHTYIF